MSVAAVIVNWNRADDTIRAVQSLPPVEHVIVVDNGSTDDSARRVREACTGIELLALPDNLGFGGGNNRGVARALELGADYVLLLNNDADVIEPSFVALLVEELERASDVGAAGPLVEFPDGSVQPTTGRLPSFAAALRLGMDRRAARPTHAAAEPVRVEFLNAVCLLVRAEAWRSVEGFDERYFMYGEEADLEFRLQRAGWALLHVPVRSIVHHHQAVTANAHAQLQMRKNFVRFCLDHRGRMSAVAVAASFLAAAFARDVRHRRLDETRRLGRALVQLRTASSTASRN